MVEVFTKYSKSRAFLKKNRFGGEGRNRTDECSFCRAVPYHLATPPPVPHSHSFTSPLRRRRIRVFIPIVKPDAIAVMQWFASYCDATSLVATKKHIKLKHPENPSCTVCRFAATLLTDPR